MLEIIWAVSGATGPILGGALTEKASWRLIFWINLPISGSTFIMLLIFLDVHNPRTSIKDGFKAIDWFGSLSILSLTLMLLIGLEFGGATFPWNSPQVVCLIVFGSLMSLFFIFSEKRLAKYPLMPLKLFSKRSNIACLLVGFGQGMVFIAGEYYLPLYFQSVLEASPLQSGTLILPIAVTEALMGITTGIIIHSTGHYLEVTYFGVILMTVGNGLYTTFSASPSLSSIVGFQIVAGIGAGALFEAPLLGLQAFVSQHDTATATGTFSFVRNLATSLSIVVGGVIFQNSMDLQVTSLGLPPVSLPTNITSALSGGSAAANVMIVAMIQDPAQKLAVKEAFACSLKNMWIFYTIVSGFTVIASAFIKRQVLSREHVETITGIRKEESVIERREN
jgi:MFS family permease